MFKPLPVQWMDIWMHRYCIKTMEVGSVAKAKLNRATNGYKSYHNDMVEAGIHFRLNYTSLIYIYKELKPLLIQWMDKWMHHYCIKTSMDVDKVAKSGQLMGTNHTTTTWLRLESTSDCITRPLYVYI